MTDCDLRAERVSKSYGEAIALDAVSLVVGSGTSAGVVGPAGSGKSTLARILAGVERPCSGAVTFNGRALTDLLASRTGRAQFRRAVQYVGPDAAERFDPRQSLRDGIRFAYRLLCRTGGGPADERVETTLRDLGLTSELADRLPGEVSLEQRRRFALARALVTEPRLLVCDGFPSLPSLQMYGRKHGLDLVLFARSLSGVRPGPPFAVDRPVYLRRGRLAEAAPQRLAA